MKKPRRQFRRRRQESDVLVVAEDHGTNFILGDPDLADLQGYLKAVRSCWWDAYRKGGIKNPIVVAVHKRSKLARERGLTDGPDFTFLAVDTHEAAREGWLHADLAGEPNRPPGMAIVLATGDHIDTHFMTNATETGVLDWGHFDPQMRQELLSNHPGLKRYLDEPWTWAE